MIKGIHTSATAMRQEIVRQEITAGNLANAGTTGFKRDRLFVQDLLAAGEAAERSADPVRNAVRWTDFDSGAFDPTGGPLDFALQGKGFFVVSDGQTELYTRNGHFQRSADGILVDLQGRAVQGEGGNISLPPGTVNVSAEGQVNVNGTVIDRLRIVDFDNPQTLRKAAASCFERSAQSSGPTPAEHRTVRQGFLESSNVDSVREMVEMIATARTYEVNARVLTAQDDSLRHSVGEIGRV